MTVYEKSFINKNVPETCPRCNTALELDTNYAENGYLSTLLCPNSNCDFEEVYAFETFEDAETED